MPIDQTCPWALNDELEKRYHDTEWGVPVKDDRVLFEYLCLESAQAGLSWRTILRKRKTYRKAYSDFDIRKISRWTEAKIQKLLLDPGIVRNELKIRAAKNNAIQFLKIQEEFGSFAIYQWSFVNSKPLIHKRKTSSDVPATTPISIEFAKDLKKRGFKFLGPTTVYAHMQASGMVNDHLTSCPCYAKIKAKMLKFKL